MGAMPRPPIPISLTACTLAMAAALGAAPAAAVERIEITIGAIAGPGWSTGRAEAALDLGAADDAMAAALRVEQPRLPAMPAITHAALACPRLAVTATGIACREGRAELPLPWLDGPGFGLDLDYRLADGGLRAAIEGVALAGGQARGEARGDLGDWRLEAAGREFDLVAIADLLGPWLPPLPEGLEYSGRLGLELNAAGNDTTLGRAQLRADLGEAAFADASGLRAGEDVAAVIEAEARRAAAGWAFDAGLRWQAGGVYIDPWYVEAKEQPISARCSGNWGDGGKVRLEDCELIHPGVLEARGRLELVLEPRLALGDGRIDLVDAALDRAYKTYLQPLAAGTPGDRLTLAGTAGGGLVLEAGRPASAGLTLADASLEDQGGRFGMHGIAATLNWRQGGAVPPSSLQWQGGYLWAMDFGAASLEAELAGSRLALGAPLALPLLDGRLVVEAFDVAARETGWGGELEGYLTPISMERLSSAFGWPVFRGRVSGVLPRITFSDQRVRVGGALLMNVFDGQVVVKGLTLEHPLGVVPELRADVDIEDIDLELLTGAFAFGRIQGRLGGTIHDLVLQDWRPVAFDARFDTPEEGDFRKRISQEAVDDLTQVGGGAGIGGALFMGLFKEFRYDAIGLGCELRDGVCTMAGVAPADQGYYIVRGAGLPRIDVIGYNRRVDWSTLLSRLQRVTTSGPAVVE